MINGDRVKQAREIRGLTQAQLAHEIGVDQSRIARLERGTGDLSAHVHQIALTTAFPVSFFRQEAGPEFPLGSLLYRSRKSLTREVKSQLRQIARLGYELTASMAREFRPIDVHLQQVRKDAATAAAIARGALGLSPDTPVVHLTKRLENAGVFVIALPSIVQEHDAFSLWAEAEDLRRPVIVTTAGKPGDRMRFSIAHELGHLVMHRTSFGALATVEDEADAFASEFLMPRSAMLTEFHEPVTLGQLADLKRRWGVAMQALMRKALDLGFINTEQRKYLSKQLTARKWRMVEPVPIPLERPRLLRQMAETLHGVPIDASKVAARIDGPTRLVASILRAHQGKDGAPNPTEGDSEDRPDLGRLIRFGRG